MLAKLVSNSWPCDPPTLASHSAGITVVATTPGASKEILSDFVNYLGYEKSFYVKNIYDSFEMSISYV